MKIVPRPTSKGASGMWICVFLQSEAEVVLDVGVLKCSSVAGPLGGAAPFPSSYESSGARCPSSLEFVSKAQMAGSSGSQMLCSDTLRQSGVRMNSSCGGAFLSDTYMEFCAEECRAVSNETSTLTRACDRCAKPLRLSFGIDSSECSSLIYNEMCIVRCLVNDTGVGYKNTIELIGDSDGHLQDSLELRRSPKRWPSVFCLGTTTSSSPAVTCQEPRYQLPLPVLFGRRVEWNHHPGRGGQDDVATPSGRCQGSAVRL